MSTAQPPFPDRRIEVDEHGDGAVEELSKLARPLENDESLDALIERVDDARVVMLGAASHGTHEFHAWRARITKRLVQEKGFDFVAVEGDWPELERLNRFVKGRDDSRFAADVLRTFHRWPTWMWANQDTAELAEWMRGHNERVAPERQIGIYGLDVYSLWESMERVVAHLDQTDPDAALAARRAYECFAPFDAEPHPYPGAARLVPISREDEVVRALSEGRASAAFPEEGSEQERAFLAAQNDSVARNAERYYRTLVGAGPQSWNVRERHMGETLDRLLGFYGPSSKAVVWAHNVHVGDARFTDMAGAGEVNLGELARETYGAKNVVLVGSASHSGFVCASDAWGLPMETMIVPPARQGSLEAAMHRVGARDALYLLDHTQQGALAAPRGHREIGVVYRPRFERWGNYVPTVLPRRCDAMLYLDETRAVRMLSSSS